MKKILAFITLFTLAAAMTGCGKDSSSNNTQPETTVQTETETTQTDTTADETEADTSDAQDTTEKATAPPQEVGYEGMEAVYADSLNDGEYDINVDSSSSMFKITACSLKVNGGEMNAVLTMSSTGYEYLYMGTAEDAKNDSDEQYISSEEKDGVSVFTIPVEALDKEISCAAFSKKKQLWYDRTLVFRADSLELDAFSEGSANTADDLELSDGLYSVEVKLEGGSGKASVNSPAKLTVADGKPLAEIIWSSNKYDYMVVDGEKYEPVSTEEFSVFEIPVTVFDRAMAVSADTTAMSTPHEIEYTLTFDSSSISKWEE